MGTQRRCSQRHTPARCGAGAPLRRKGSAAHSRAPASHNHVARRVPPTGRQCVKPTWVHAKIQGMARSVSMEPCERRLAGRDPMFMRPSSFTAREAGGAEADGAVGVMVQDVGCASRAMAPAPSTHVAGTALSFGLAADRQANEPKTHTWRQLLEEVHKAGVLAHHLTSEGQNRIAQWVPALELWTPHAWQERVATTRHCRDHTSSHCHPFASLLQEHTLGGRVPLTLRYASHDRRAISDMVSRHSCGGCCVGASVASSTADV